jgi:hypothetical protein
MMFLANSRTIKMSAFRQALLAMTFVLAAPGAMAQSDMSPEMRMAAKAATAACRPDYDRFCKGTMPGGGRVRACLDAHAAELSGPCTQAIASIARAKAAGAVVEPPR